MFTPKLLASGQLPSSKGTLYTTPTGMRATIDSVIYYNTTGGALTCDTFLNISSTSRQIESQSVPAASQWQPINPTSSVYLGAGNLVEGVCGSATSVNYFVFGKEEQKG